MLNLIIMVAGITGAIYFALSAVYYRVRYRGRIDTVHNQIWAGCSLLVALFAILIKMG